jgi:predicted nicotinamide N-methyase
MSAFPERVSVLGSVLRPRRLPLVPELALWLLGDDVDLNSRVPELLAVERAPYWAFCWGSGQALARFILDRPQLVQGKRVADFGAGCGVVAIAAMRAGAAKATAVDIDDVALEAAQANASLNGVHIDVSLRLPEHFDLLAGSDVLYEVGNRDFLADQIALGRSVLLADPLRQGNPRLELTPAAHFEVRCVPDVDYPVAQAVIYHLHG